MPLEQLRASKLPPEKPQTTNDTSEVSLLSFPKLPIAENIMFRLTKGKYARICIPLDKDEIYIGDTSNDLREISDIDSTMKEHINLAINLAKTEILKRLKN